MRPTISAHGLGRASRHTDAGRRVKPKQKHGKRTRIMEVTQRRIWHMATATLMVTSLLFLNACSETDMGSNSDGGAGKASQSESYDRTDSRDRQWVLVPDPSRGRASRERAPNQILEV